MFCALGDRRLPDCLALFAGLCDESSTGPDFVPARILKRCAEQVAKPIKSLLQRMIEKASWARVLA